ncbi:MAG: SCP-like extracellular [Ruminococcus sp.]|nr:SCP-like extracellular [Ruminococcus sp.]
MLGTMMKKVTGFVSAAVMAATVMVNGVSGAFAAEEIADNELRSMANEVAVLVNEAREELGLAPLYVVPYLNELGDLRASEIVDDFSHSRGGQRFSSVVDTDIVKYSVIAENIAAGSDNAVDTFNQWKNSPSHWKSITNPDITHIGIGVYYDPDSTYGWYWQQLFVSTKQTFEDQYLPTDYEVVPKSAGDITGDGVINSYDYIELSNYIYKAKNRIPVYLNEAQLEAADVFEDGIISESDAKVMVRFLLGEYKSLPFVF